MASPVIDDPAAYEAETEELRRDLEARRERREAGLEPPTWEVPPDSPYVTKRAPDERSASGLDAMVNAAVKAAAGRIRKDLNSVMEDFAKEVGHAFADETKLQKGLIGKLREELPQLMKAHIPGAIAEEATKLRKELQDNKRNEVSELLRWKHDLEGFRTEQGREILRLEKEIVELKRLLVESRR